MRMVAATALAVSFAVALAGRPGASSEPAQARVRAVLDAATVELSDGRHLRLAQIRPPEAGTGDGVLADRARKALATLILDRDVVLRFPGPRFDRYDRLVARVELPDGTWVQARLVEQGWVRVASDEDHIDGLDDLLVREKAARDERRGVWRDWRYRVMDPQAAARAPEGFHLVEGTVAQVATVGAWTYLNFGEDWRTDFTISVHRRDRRRMQEGLGVLAALAGRRVRVRGWMRHFNGPMVEATYPQQIELLD